MDHDMNKSETTLYDKGMYIKLKRRVASKSVPTYNQYQTKLILRSLCVFQFQLKLIACHL